MVLAMALLAGACAGGGRPTVTRTTVPPTVSAGALSLNAGPAPWPAPDHARARIAEAGLPALASEQLAYHVHAHLDLIVNGVNEPVPAGLGIDPGAGVISPLHTHDGSGMLHIESSRQAPFTLGELLVEWGVRVDDHCVGAYCSPATPIAVYVGGNLQPSGDPRPVVLGQHVEVALVIGPAPDHVPDHYLFPAGQ